MEGPDQTNPCAICLSGMVAGGGQATFTAECSHTFHFSCISASVAHGNLVCPLCNAQWRDLPFARPTPVPQPPRGHVLQHFQPPPPHILPHRQPPSPTPDPVVVFDDDEQVEPASGTTDSRQPAPAGAASNGAVVVKTHTECSAVARDSSSDNFAVLVHIKAPGMIDTAEAQPRAPLDLVTVLDVSGSMSGHKLALLKQAMRFVIDNLGPGDRLSVVSFSSEARRVTRLTRMTDAGKASCISAVESLAARGGTNITEGLRTAAKVLDERRHRNPVSSVVLLSDGQDTYTMMRRRGSEANNYEALIPPSFLRTGGEWSAPIHTFGFGNDHDAAAMHVIAESTVGTFSFIENEAVIQDAFAQCIGGLLSVVVQEARLAVACVHPGVRVISVNSGRYESRVDEDGRAASIRVGELYADEERRFLLFLSVPRAESTDGENTALVKVVCSYKDAVTGGDASVMAEEAVVARPEQALDTERSLEVERERVRVDAAEDIAAARVAAERGAYQEAVEILENRQRVVEQSGDGDAVIVALGAELQDMRGRVSSHQNYARSGRASLLAGYSAHAQQRANSSPMQQIPASGNWEGPSMVSFHAVGAAPQDEASYATPAMRAMLLRSRRASAEQGQQPKAGEEAQTSEPEVHKT